MQFLGQNVNAQVVVTNIAKFPFTRVVPICIPASRVREHWFPHNLANRCVIHLFNFCQSDRWKLYPRVFSICTSLIMSEVEHIFICLKAICIFYANYLFVFCPFFMRAFLSPNFNCSLYIKDINPLHLMYVISVFSHFVICILTVLMVGFWDCLLVCFAMAKVFYFMNSNLSVFYYTRNLNHR